MKTDPTVKTDPTAKPSPYDSKERRRLEEKITERRREVQARLDDVRNSVEREASWLPTGRDWLSPLMGFAIGVALAKGRRRDEPAGSGPARDAGPRDAGPGGSS